MTEQKRFTIAYKNSSCVGIGIVKYIEISLLIQCINNILGTKRQNTVIIRDSYQDNPKVFNNALLYLDVNYHKQGISMSVDLWSVKIHQIIRDWNSFFLSLAQEMDSDIFIENDYNDGFLIKKTGSIVMVDFEEIYEGDDNYDSILIGRELGPCKLKFI